jgi:inner membrane protein
LALGLGLAWGLDMVPRVVAFTLSLGAGVLLFGFYRAKFAQRVSVGWALVGVVLLAFTWGGRSAAAAVRRVLAKEADRSALLDVVVTPAPGNPLCYGVLAVQGDRERYLAAAGWVSLWPGALSARDCRIQPTGMTAGLSAPPLGWQEAAGRGLVWEGSWSGSSEELRRLWQSNCQVQAWLRFARVPFWQPASGARWLLGDLRFDRAPELDFDEFHVEAAPTTCPSYVPGWLEPRRDVLRGARPE